MRFIIAVSLLPAVFLFAQPIETQITQDFRQRHVIYREARKGIAKLGYTYRTVRIGR